MILHNESYFENGAAFSSVTPILYKKEESGTIPKFV